MDKPTDELHPNIDPDQLTAIARLACDQAKLELEDWQATQLGGNAGNPVSLGLYRIAGQGRVEGVKQEWSVVLKMIQSPARLGWVNMGEGDDPRHWNYWKREMYAYRSGLLERLPAGLAAPRCYKIEELPGEITWLWLEDLHDCTARGWTLERYARTAGHLGRLNGLSELDGEQPDWLSRQRSRQWVEGLPHREAEWEHPRLLERYPPAKANPFRRMLANPEPFLERLEQMPQTISHGDTYPTNFLSRCAEAGQEQTLALDWALMGLAPAGDDLGQFVYGALARLTEWDEDILIERLFAAYLEGLRESGCRLPAEQVRFGFTASAALRVGLFQVFLLGEEIRASGTSGQTGPGNPSLPECFEVRMAREAYRLLEGS